MFFSEEITLLKQKCEYEFIAFKQSTCCFTGHRPQSLPWGFDEEDKRCVKMKEQLKGEVVKAIENGYTTFISGMALGFDIIAAEVVLELKEKHPNIKLVGALPCKTQDKFWKEKDKQRYKNVLNKLDDIRCIYDNYNGKKCMIERNHYMVNNSSLVIALFNGTKGGTKTTINYAKKQGLKIVVLIPPE